MVKEISDVLNFEKAINYTFKNKRLLIQAFSHSSYINEKHISSIESNERLEFLGDSVLELVISDYLYKKYTTMPEGELTKFRAAIVCEASLTKEAKTLKIGEYLILGKGEKCTGGDMKDSMLADAFESVIGAIYLDSDIDNVRKYIITIMEPAIEDMQKSFRTMDYKTYLQEIIQKNSKENVVYQIINELGPDHSKEFTAIAKHNNKKLGQGVGKTKKEAEQNAALDALNKKKIDSFQNYNN